MKTLMLSATLMMGTFLATAQHEGVAVDKDGVVFYIEAMPANQYRHLGTVECSALSPDDIDPMLDHMIKQAKKKYPEFDALIFRSGKGLCKADVVQFYRDPKEKKKRGRAGEVVEINAAYKMSKAQPKNGTVVYVKNNPANEYALLGKVEIPVTFRSKDIEELMMEIIRIAKESYPDLDAIVVMEGSNMRKASVIKYK